MRKFTDWGPAFLVLVATMVALFAAPSMVRKVEFAQTSARVTLARQALEEDDILIRIDQAVRQIAESVSPSVVHIDVRVENRALFASSSGSGWLFDADGHIVTNSHVLRGADRIRVQLNDGRLFEATLVGADPLTDIAVLRLPNVDGLIPAVRATDVHARQGERVFAFGSPFGFKFSMSEGIVSGLGREPAGAVAASSGYTNFIQTDAAVNPGNSGGPLVNVRGQVVGMNVAIATGNDSEGTTEGQSAGISFAIPLAVIESVVTQLIYNGEVRRGFLGVNLPRRWDDAQRAGYNGYGVYVPGVSEGGPAELAGLKVGDVITAIDGETVTGVGVLRSMISTVQPGETIDLRVWRGGDELVISPVLAEAGAEVTVGSSVLGELQRIGLQFGGNNSVGMGDRPVMSWVFPGSPAVEMGFASGQRIVEVGGEPVRTIGDMTERFVEAGLLIGREVEVLVEELDLDTGETRRQARTLRINR
ncbi:MAG: trypsin-like peptidase domain-containing protein [Phycisphaerales bacterium JB041]